jgi:hypothetical protein
VGIGTIAALRRAARPKTLVLSRGSLSHRAD